MAKNWDINQVPALVFRIYNKVLEREPTKVELIHYGSRLDRGEQTVQSIVRELALSPEHLDRFIRVKTVEEGVKTCYRHLLGCDATPGKLATWTQVFEQEGVDNVINGLMDSEYTDKFGDDMVTCLIWSHAPGGDWAQAHTDVIINYVFWDGTNWTAKLDGDLFFHAPNGDWSQAHTDIIIKFVAWDGTNWTARPTNGLFVQAQDEDWSQAHIFLDEDWSLPGRSDKDWILSHSREEISYISWGGSKWTAKLVP